ATEWTQTGIARAIAETRRIASEGDTGGGGAQSLQADRTNRCEHILEIASLSCVALRIETCGNLVVFNYEKSHTTFICREQVGCVGGWAEHSCFWTAGGHRIARSKAAGPSGELGTAISCAFCGCRKGRRVTSTDSIWRSGIEEIYPRGKR